MFGLLDIDIKNIYKALEKFKEIEKAILIIILTFPLQFLLQIHLQSFLHPLT
ncbi:hypothetical protein SAMN04488529_101168 [Clostridium gasigenes]|uniref:Uncharacterized protein n=1 Tax=Clostridium gasigenes TaxID=94869 RepID=A0A1H0LQM1_9CLOT|nr:hypothetical protein SAMN04488529_101168 [Clostridium gasigenes]